MATVDVNDSSLYSPSQLTRSRFGGHSMLSLRSSSE